MWKRIRWSTHTILAFGVLLRLGLTLAVPPECAYDDHYEPVKIILDEGRIPDASDCWECYQPPLYYLVSAAGCSVTQSIARWSGATEDTLEYVGRRSLQFISLIAGCVTLYICLLIFRFVRILTPYEALGMALIAFLPRHIYMSAMATNDALTYFVASCAIYAVLRASAAGWPTRGCLVAGALSGATVLCKAYGWLTVGALLFAIWLFTRRRSRPTTLTGIKRTASKPLILVASISLFIGVWPVLRNMWVYERPLVDNFDFHDSPMRFQPPGSLTETSFISFRLISLLRYPWLHLKHVNSFWTQLYGRLWFDYEGFETTLSSYPPWQKLWERCAQAHPIWTRARWEMLLDYNPNEVPPGFKRVAVISLLAGLPLTICVLAGGVIALRQIGRDFAITLLLVHFTLAMFVPLFQTWRLPYFAAMKAAFMLSGLATAPILVGLVLSRLHGTKATYALYTVLWLAVIALAAAECAFVALKVYCIR